MGIARWMFNDLFTAHELDGVDSRIEEQGRRLEREADLTADALGTLRADLERLALLTHSLAHLCLEKGVLTRDELRARMFELDLADGTQDGRMKPPSDPLAGS